MNKNEQSKCHIGKAVCVRLSPIEYKRIEKESRKTGKSIPKLLRESHFHQPPRKVLIGKNDVAFLRKDLNRIGNNLNQVTKRLNSGLMHGWSNTLELILKQFEDLTRQVHYGYGVPQN